jgi:hypothetical protein
MSDKLDGGDAAQYAAHAWRGCDLSTGGRSLCMTNNWRR